MISNDSNTRTTVMAMLVVIAAAGSPATAGCDGDDGPPGETTKPVGGNGHRDGGAGERLLPGFSSCSGADAGQPCGPAHHCIAGRCLQNECGDGVRAGEEECDDGNEVLGDECSPSCKATPATCGDGEIDDGEECDDGNLITDDACSNSCTINLCGNGRVDPGEQCDDGNATDDDACSNACTRNLCRNGILDPGEECDDGNTSHADGCTNDCKIVTCGDGIAEVQEECDDGNQIDDDACSNACTINACNNGRIDPGEVCDTGMTAGGEPIADGSQCNPDCSGLVSDVCGECEYQSHCTDYMGSGFDLPRFCYDEVPEGSSVISDFNRKCADLVRCIRRNRCDLTGPQEDPFFCYCGNDTTIDDCLAGHNIVGPCVREYEAATDAAPGDFVHVSNSATDLALPSGRAVYLAQCQRENCLAVCR